jgi:hypothetical protein
MRTGQGRNVLVLALCLWGAIGCRGVETPRSLASSEPTLDSAPDANSVVVEAPPAKQVTFADRHPLFSRPREYYETTGRTKVAKVAAATFIGIPAGIVGEVRQIVVGRPPDSGPY